MIIQSVCFITLLMTFFMHSSPVSVPNGGTGVSSLTAYAVVCAGTTSINPLQSIASVGTAGQLLTSNGSGALPTFQNTPAATISVSVADVTLTNAQIKALNATPVQIIAAPGVGLFLLPFATIFKLNTPTGQAFTAAAAQTIRLQYNAAASLISTFISNATLTQTTNQAGYNCNIPSVSSAYASMSNQAISASNPVATEISGNANNDNTIRIIIYYTTLTI